IAASRNAARQLDAVPIAFPILFIPSSSGGASGQHRTNRPGWVGLATLPTRPTIRCDATPNRQTNVDETS
ncbi:MAG: hypothetical protein V3T64_10985, partial [Myxococcota bacterium]